MPLIEDNIRELLRDRSSEPPSNSERLSQVRKGIHRARRRRTAVSGVAAITGVVAVSAVGLGGFDGDRTSVDPTVRPSPTATAPTPAELPKTFTGKNGVTYALVGSTSMRQPEEQEVHVNVRPREGRPLDVAATCAPLSKVSPDEQASPPRIDVLVDGKWYGGVSLGCGERLDTAQLILPKGKRMFRVTFTSGRLGGERASAAWSIGLYEWTPPNKSDAAPKVPRLPDPSADGEEPAYHLLGSKSGTWPDSRTVKITVPYRGQQLAVATICRGGAAERMETVGILIDGKLEDDTGPCDAEGLDVGEMTALHRPVLDRAAEKGSVTVELRIHGPNSNGRDDAAYKKLPFGWRVGIYERAG